MRFPFEDAPSQKFEDFVVEVCVYLLGEGVHGFSTGPDGGRDARFQGVARNFPNEKSPYSGKFIIQAKHTENPAATFSDNDFSGASQNSVLSKEIPRIKSLVDNEECDHYFLFSNRRMAGNAEERMRNIIIEETGVNTVDLFGEPRFDSFLRRHPEAIEKAGLTELKRPLIVSPDDLFEIIDSLHNSLTGGKVYEEGVMERTSF